MTDLKEIRDSNLKNCPFCGGRAFGATVEHTKESRPFGYWFHGRIMCEKCQAVCGATGFDETYESATVKAIAAWNRRADDVEGVWAISGTLHIPVSTTMLDSLIPSETTLAFLVGEDLAASGYVLTGDITVTDFSTRKEAANDGADKDI